MPGGSEEDLDAFLVRQGFLAKSSIPGNNIRFFFRLGLNKDDRFLLEYSL